MADDTKPFDSYITEAKPVKPSASKPSLAYAVFKPLASLQLTVTLFVLAVILVFYGTVAQRVISTWDAVEFYFRSWYVWIPNQLNAEFCKVFFDLDKEAEWKGHFPFPGGWTLGVVFLVNLVSAHIVRFKIRWNRAGMILLHLGVALLLVGEAITGLTAVEGVMTMRTGESSNVVDVFRQYELAFIKPGDGKIEEGVVVVDSLLKPGATISHPDLPVDIEVLEHWPNTESTERLWGPMMPFGRNDIHVKIPGMADRTVSFKKTIKSAGSAEASREDSPTVIIRLTGKGTDAGKPPVEMLLTTFHQFYQSRGALVRKGTPDTVEATAGQGGTPVNWRVVFRNKRVVKPYRIELEKFEHKVYPGSTIPKDFASTVRLKDDRSGENRQVRIWMNHPLTYQGDTFYQHQFMPGDGGTVLMVVRNPGALLPYLSCMMVTLGMLIHFGISLNKHLAKGARK